MDNTVENTEGTIQIWTIWRNWEHRVHNRKTKRTNTQLNMCWTPEYTSKHKWRK